MATAVLLVLPDELLVACVDGSLRICVKLAATNSKIRYELHVATTRYMGLRLAAADLPQVWKISNQLSGWFYIGELVLSCSVWPFTDMAHGGQLFALIGHNDLLHTIWVNPEHKDKVHELYNDFGSYSEELNEMKESGFFKIIARSEVNKVVKVVLKQDKDH